MPSFHNQTIVVPFDFSAPSKNALTKVRQWADDSNTIHLIYVVVPTITIVEVTPPISVPPQPDFETREMMLEKMKSDYAFPNMEHHCVVGYPANEIVELAKTKKADMIVMPSHGRSGFSRLFLGSVAERVLRLSECPVLILRGTEFEGDFVTPEVRATAAS